MRADAKRTTAALRELSVTLDGAATDFAALAARARRLAADLDDGRPLTATIAAEVRPLIVTEMTRLIDRLNEAGGEVRRAEAQQLRGEGNTHEQIAAEFGVSRQRAAALLKPQPKDGRGPHRPKALRK